MKTQVINGIRDDLFTAVEYAKRNGKNGPCTGLCLGRHWIFEQQFRSAWARLRDGIDAADWTKPQSAKSLFNDPHWKSMKFGVRIAIGRCLRFFVNKGMLPLQVINPQATGTKLYMPINQ